MVADTVFDPATVDESVPVATPLAFVVPTGWVRVFPAVAVPASVTVAPCIGLPLAPVGVPVLVELPPPAAIGGVALTADWAADTVPGFSTTVTACVTATPLI